MDPRPSALPSALLLVLALLLGASCRAPDRPDEVPLDIVLSQLPSEPPAYRLQPGDVIEVRFFQFPDQTVTLPVRPDGLVSLPLAPEVRAAGRTPEELRLELEQSYSKELRDPQLAVIVQTFGTYKVHVGGEVTKPGVFDLGGGRTALDVVFEAGGFLSSASASDTIVIRRTGERQFMVIPLDLEAAMEGRDLRQNMMLQPFDLVYVPSSTIGDVNRWVDLYLRKNIPFSLSVGWRVDIPNNSN